MSPSKTSLQRSSNGEVASVASLWRAWLRFGRELDGRGGGGYVRGCEAGLMLLVTHLRHARALLALSDRVCLAVEREFAGAVNNRNKNVSQVIGTSN